MATKDFRASQIETSKIIGTGSISGTTAGIAIYSGSIATNREGGNSDSAMFNSVGNDVFLFVSGTRSNNNFTRKDATLFGGDVVISGTLYAERQVIEVDSVADGDFFVTGNMYVEPDINSTNSVAFRTAAGNDIFIVDSSNKRIGVNVSDPDAQVEIFGTSTPHLKLSNNVDDFATFAVGTHGDLTITTVDAAAGAANFVIDADGAVDIDADAGALSLDGSAGINIGTEADVAIDINSSTLDIDASGALTIDSATSIAIGTNADKPVSIDSTSFALDASTTVAIDGTSISIDGVDDSNITVTASAKDLDIAVAGGGTQELRLTSAGTGTSALRLNASAGNVDIDAVGPITIDGDRLLISDPSPPGTDTLFSVSGSIGSKSTSTKGTSVFGGDTVISGGLYVNETIFSANDTDTKIVFSNDQIDFFAGNERLLKLDEAADDEVVVGDGGDVNFRVATKGYGYNLYVKSDHNAGAENAVSIRHASPQEVFHVSGSTRIDSEGRPNVLFISGTLGDNSHQVLILSGGSGASTDESAGADVAFYVSGTVGSIGTSVRGTSVFGGDIAISGSATLLSTLSVGGDLLPVTDDTHDLGSASLAWQDLFLEGDITFTDAGKIVTTAGDLTIEAEAADAKVTIKGDHTSGTSIHIDGNAAAGSIVDIDAGILDIDASGALTIDSATSIYIGGTADKPVSIDSAAFALDASSTVAIDGVGISIDSTDNSNITVTGTAVVAKNLDISAVNNGKIILSGTSGNDSVHVTSDITIDGKSFMTDDVQITANKKIFFDGASVSNGPFIRGNTVALTVDGDNRLLFYYDQDAVFHDINDKTPLVMNNGQVLILSGGPATSVNETDYTDLAFFVSGSMGSRGTSTKGTAVFGGDVVISGTLHGGSPLKLGADIGLNFDGSKFAFGVNNEITLTHVHDVGLTVTNTIADADNKPVVFQLKSEEDVIVADDVIASIEFAAGDAGGTDAADVAAGIHAIAEGAFGADANATKLVFTTGVQESANSGATAKMTLDSAGNLKLAGELQAANIGYTDGDNAIVIANGGGITAAAGITSTAAANSLGATSFNDANITNVGILEVDTIQSADDAVGLNINFDGNNDTNSITIPDNLADSLVIKEGSNLYAKFATTNTSELITLFKPVEITNGAAGGATALIIDNDDVDQKALLIEAANTTAHVVDISANALTTKQALKIEVNALTTGGGFTVESSSTQTDAGNLVKIKQSGTRGSDSNNHNGLFIDYDVTSGTAARALKIDSQQTTGKVFELDADAITTGTGMAIHADALTTGAAFEVTSNSSTTNSPTEVVRIFQEHASATGRVPLNVKNIATNTGANGSPIIKMGQSNGDTIEMRSKSTVINSNNSGTEQNVNDFIPAGAFVVGGVAKVTAAQTNNAFVTKIGIRLGAGSASGTIHDDFFGTYVDGNLEEENDFQRFAPNQGMAADDPQVAFSTAAQLKVTYNANASNTDGRLRVTIFYFLCDG